jgi:uncharacterized protein
MLKIKISNLKDGRHHFDFEKVAADFGLSEKQFPNPIFVLLDLEKKAAHYILSFTAKTNAVVECDRTLQEFTKSVEGSYSLLYVTDASGGESVHDETRALQKNDIDIDLTEDVRETLILAVPLRNVIEDSEDELKLAFEYKHPNAVSEETAEGLSADKWVEALQRLKVQTKN